MNIFGAIIDTISLALLLILGVSTIVLFVYYGVFYLRIGIYKGKKEQKLIDKKTEFPPISIVLTAKNESNDLKENLAYLLEQDYPNFEVIVVDHASQDDTKYVLQLYKENYPHLKIVRFLKDVNLFQGKKFPLSIGIKSAKNDIILLTECNCIPKSFTWIREIVSHFHQNTNIVLGFSGFKSNNTLLNWFIQYDNLAYASSFLGFALMGNPYTGCGRNLAYRRSFFFEKNGFIHHYNIATGDDDIFVNQNATPGNTTICLSPDSLIIANPKKTFPAWCLQRKKRMSTQKYYSFSNKLSLAIYPLSVILFYATLITLFFTQPLFWKFLMGIIIIKWGWQIFTFYKLAHKLGVKKIAYFSPIFELYFTIVNTITYFTTLKRKNTRWK